MIAELLAWWRIDCLPAARRLGYRREAAALVVRHRRLRDHWADHLAHTRAALRASARQAAEARDALWATEQCLRAGCLSAVLCWPQKVDDRALRRLQVAAESGQALAFAFRDARVAAQPSPAALRLQFEAGQLRVLKCRGGLAPAHPVPFPLH